MTKPRLSFEIAPRVHKRRKGEIDDACWHVSVGKHWDGVCHTTLDSAWRSLEAAVARDLTGVPGRSSTRHSRARPVADPRAPSRDAEFARWSTFFGHALEDDTPLT